jgi:hypothetical protein
MWCDEYRGSGGELDQRFDLFEHSVQIGRGGGDDVVFAAFVLVMRIRGEVQFANVGFPRFGGQRA